MRVPRVPVGTAVLFGVALVGWAIILVSSEQQAKVKWWQVGCYNGAQEFKDVALHITHDGMLKFPGAAVPVHLINDKEGDSFEAEQRIIIDADKHALTVTPGYPDLFRINSDGSFYVPDGRSELILFVPCART